MGRSASDSVSTEIEMIKSLTRVNLMYYDSVLIAFSGFILYIHFFHFILSIFKYSSSLIVPYNYC